MDSLLRGDCGRGGSGCTGGSCRELEMFLLLSLACREVRDKALPFRAV